MSKPQKAWETMRNKKAFLGSDIMASKKDNALLYYLNAIERVGYIKQVESAKHSFDRKYLLVRDTGEKAPIYQTSRTRNGTKVPAMVKDKNISKEYFLEDFPPIKKVNLLEEKFLSFIKEREDFTYDEALPLFEDETHPKGYKYSLFHYYLSKFLEKEIIFEKSKHFYELCK